MGWDIRYDADNKWVGLTCVADTFQAEGTVQTTRDYGLEGCVIRRSRVWRFPNDVEDDIRLPFELEAN